MYESNALDFGYSVVLNKHRSYNMEGKNNL